MITNIVSKVMLVGGGLVPLLLVGQVLHTEAWSSHRAAHKAPQLSSHLMGNIALEKAEAAFNSQGAVKRVNARSSLKSVSKELKSILVTSQQIRDQLLAEYELIISKKVGQDELELALARAKKTCQSDIQKLKDIWEQLEQVAESDGNHRKVRFALQRGALEAAADTLKDVVEQNQSLLVTLESMKGKNPFPLEGSGQLQEYWLPSSRDKIMGANQKTLEIVEANLQASTTVEQRAEIEQVLAKLLEEERKLTASQEFTDANLKCINETFEKIRGLRIEASSATGAGDIMLYEIAFKSLSARRRNLVLAELEKLPGLVFDYSESPQTKHYLSQGLDFVRLQTLAAAKARKVR